MVPTPLKVTLFFVFFLYSFYILGYFVPFFKDMKNLNQLFGLYESVLIIICATGCVFDGTVIKSQRINYSILWSYYLSCLWVMVNPYFLMKMFDLHVLKYKKEFVFGISIKILEPLGITSNQIRNDWKHFKYTSNKKIVLSWVL